MLRILLESKIVMRSCQRKWFLSKVLNAAPGMLLLLLLLKSLFRGVLAMSLR